HRKFRKEPCGTSLSLKRELYSVKVRKLIQTSCGNFSGRGTRWLLSFPDLFLCSVGDTSLLPMVLDAALQDHGLKKLPQRGGDGENALRNPSHYARFPRVASPLELAATFQACFSISFFLIFLLWFIRFTLDDFIIIWRST
ncbi:MAG: hypothetical protein SVR04_16915, partial [Spirochaetota bacterium]|nr:hypothetical protein [Spirochaetota bacterium]